MRHFTISQKILDNLEFDASNTSPKVETGTTTGCKMKLEGLILVDWQLVSNINGYKKSTLKVESLKNKDGQRLKNLQKN